LWAFLKFQTELLHDFIGEGFYGKENIEGSPGSVPFVQGI
jgi:hypothetical protein